MINLFRNLMLVNLLENARELVALSAEDYEELISLSEKRTLLPREDIVS